MQYESDGRPTSPMLIFGEMDKAKRDAENENAKRQAENAKMKDDVSNILNNFGLEGVFEDFTPEVQNAVAESMKHMLTNELQGLTPKEQVKKLKKMFPPKMKGGRKRRRKRTRRRRKSRRRKKKKKTKRRR